MRALAIDSSAAIAFFTATDAHHDRAVREVGAAADSGTALSMSASAYSEIAAHAVRLERRDVVERFVDRLRIEIVPVDRELASAAAELLTFDSRLAHLAGEAAQS